jgi:AbiV family abortive infection protein
LRPTRSARKADEQGVANAASLKPLASAKSTRYQMSNIEIPVSQIDIGLGLCAVNIRRFVEDVNILLENSSILHATALAIFAVEELAKYSELKKAKISATGPNAQVEKRLFYLHEYKQELAKEFLPKDALILSPAVFDAGVFDSKVFQTEGVGVSDATRLECIFVDWKDGHWIYGASVQISRLRQLTQYVLDTLTKLESSLA